MHGRHQPPTSATGPLRAACAARCARPSARCRRGAAAALRRPAASRSAARACARPAGRSSPSSRRPIASGSASRSRTIPAPACSRWRRSPIRRPTSAPARRCATTTSRARWCMRFKYGDRLDLAPDDGPLDGERRPRARSPRPTRIVPVPLHWRRQWARRFNQSALLGRGHRQGAAACRSRTRALKRVKATPQQVGLSQAERAAERAGRLPRAAGGKAAGRGTQARCWSTTCSPPGATVDACARALLRAGAAQVDVLVFARVVAAARAPI